MLTLLRSIGSVLAYRFHSGRRLVKRCWIMRHSRTCSEKTAEACALGLRWSLQLAGGRSCRECRNAEGELTASRSLVMAQPEVRDPLLARARRVWQKFTWKPCSKVF